MEGQIGSVLCLGHLIGYLMTNEKSRQSQVTVEDMEVDVEPQRQQLGDGIKTAVIDISKKSYLSSMETIEIFDPVGVNSKRGH